MRENNRIGAAALAAFGVLVTTTDLTTNFGSIAWQRGTNIEESKISTVRFDDSRADVDELQEKKKFFERRLADLEATSGWTAGKPSAAYDGEIEAARMAVEIEAKRGGCKSRCLARKQELAELEANRATALAHEKDAEMLAATIAGLQKTRAASAQVEKVESAAALQNVSLASMFTLSRTPTEDAQHWTDKGVAWLVAAFFSFGAMGCNWIGWGTPSGGGGSSRRREDSTVKDAFANLKPQSTAVTVSPTTRENTTIVYAEDNSKWAKVIAEAIEGARRNKQVAA
jgi:hypothetical protein